MLKLLRQLQHRIEEIEMSNSNVKALEEKIWIFEQQLKDEKAPSNATLEASKSRQHDLVEKMEANDLECESLRVRLYRSTAKFAKFKEQTRRKAALQERAIMTHSEQVQNLKSLAEQDREWLVEETSKRIAASTALRKASHERVQTMQRRCSADW
jgi:hypothetical protein